MADQRLTADERVEVLLDEIGAECGAARDELAEEPALRRYDELQLLGGELRGVLGNLVQTVRVAKDPLPLQGACERALGDLKELLAEASSDEAALAALDVEPDVQDLVTLSARLEVASRLRNAPVRETAAAVGVTPGYVSELRGAKKGLPSEDVASRLDTAVPATGDDRPLLDVVQWAKADVAELTEQRHARRGGTRVAGTVIRADLRGEDRLAAVAEHLRRDESLLRAVEGLVDLAPRERRAVTRLIAELAE